MSGGAFDYRDHVLYELQDYVARELGSIEYGHKNDYSDYNDKTIIYMKNICKQLGELGDVLHALDWFLSGDTGEDSFISEYEKVYNREK